MDMSERLPALLDQILPFVRFSVPGVGLWAITDFRRGYRESQTPAGIRRGLRSFFFTLAEVDLTGEAEPLFEKLVEILHTALEPHIDPKTSQIAFSTTLPLGWSWPQPDVRRFCRQIIRCAALAGSNQAVNLLEGCIRGVQVTCTHITAIEGVRQEQNFLDFRDGIRLVKLSKSFEDLVQIVPAMLAPKLLAFDPFAFDTQLPGATAICKDLSATLSIVSPKRATRALDENFFPDPLELQSLSLACGVSVESVHHWTNLNPHLGALTGCQIGLPGSSQTPHSRTVRPRLNPFSLTQECVDNARRYHDELHGYKEDAQFQVALERWQSSSTGSGGIVNDAIDIRIALEALFAPTGSKAELGHRIALRAAWYLGNDPDNRIHYYQLVKRAYDLCSSAVHSGTFRRHGGSPNDPRALLSEARNACREALIKHLAKGRKLDDDSWTALVLGKSCCA